MKNLLDLDEIEARANAATPGPWMTKREEPLRDENGWPLYTAVAGTDKTCGVWGKSGSRYPWADARFIAAAREYVPALIAECRELRAENAAQKRRIALDAELAVADNASYRKTIDEMRAENKRLRAMEARVRDLRAEIGMLSESARLDPRKIWNRLGDALAKATNANPTIKKVG